jgi:hypothetical protein
MAARLIFIASILLIVGAFLLLVFLLRLTRRISYFSRTRRLKKAPGGVSSWSISLAIILIIISWAFFWMGHQLKGFYAYRPDARVCRIDVEQNDDPVKSMKCIIWPPGDTLQTPPAIYLSGNAWHIRGQYVRITGVLEKLFPGRHGFKVTDLYGGYTGERPPSNEQSPLMHQIVEGGPNDLESYIETIGFLRKSIQIGEFETQAVSITPNTNYWIVLSDSGATGIEIVGTNVR